MKTVDNDHCEVPVESGHSLSSAKVTGSEKGHDDHGTAPELSGHCLSTAKVDGSAKGHDNHRTVLE